MPMDALGAAWFVFALCGWGVWLRRRWDLHPDLLPVVVVSGVIVTLFFAGLLNVLPHTVYVVLTAGALLGVRRVIEGLRADGPAAALRRGASSMSPGLWALAAMVVAQTILLADARLLAYDNFSHWALIVKQMHLQDRLPNFSDRMIVFQAYPPGSALFIYSFVKVAGFGEARMLMAQAAMESACLVSLFSALSPVGEGGPGASRARRAYQGVFAAGLIALLSIWGRGEINLLVDSLLAYFGVAIMAVVYRYRDDPTRAACWAAPVMAATALVKNSGLFFALAGTALLLAIYLRSRGARSLARPDARLASFLICLALPFLCLLFWQRHVGYVFLRGESSKHAMTAENYRREFSAKSDEDIALVRERFFAVNKRMMFATGWKQWAGWHLFLVVFFLLARKLEGRWNARLPGALLFADLAFGCYLAGLLGMYLFSMPMREARNVAGYSRYFFTINHFVIGVAGLAVIDALGRMVRRWSRHLFGLAAVVWVAALLAINANGNIPAARPGAMYRAGAAMRTLDEVLPEDMPGGRYILYVPPAGKGTLDQDYTQKIVSYRMYSPRFAVAGGMGKPESLRAALGGAEWLQVLEYDEPVRDLLKGVPEAPGAPKRYAAKDVLEYGRWPKADDKK